MKWTPDTIIALVLVVGCLILLGFGLNSEVKSILTVSAGWAFGAQYHERIIKCQAQKQQNEQEDKWHGEQ